MIRGVVVIIVLVASSALLGCATEQGAQIREEVVKETREERLLAPSRRLSWRIT